MSNASPGLPYLVQFKRAGKVDRVLGVLAHSAEEAVHAMTMKGIDVENIVRVTPTDAKTLEDIRRGSRFDLSECANELPGRAAHLDDTGVPACRPTPNTVKLRRAHSAGSAGIFVSEDLPGALGIDDARQIFADDADKLAEALVGSLPGGTLDALLMRLLQHKASDFTRAAREPPKPLKCSACGMVLCANV